MQLWQDGLVAMLAAIGLASVMWTAVKAVLFAGENRRTEIAALLPAQGSGEHLEEQVNVLQRLRQEQGVFGKALLVDCGLTEEGRKIADLLARKHRWVILCEKDEIGGCLDG